MRFRRNGFILLGGRGEERIYTPGWEGRGTDLYSYVGGERNGFILLGGRGEGIQSNVHSPIIISLAYTPI